MNVDIWLVNIFVVIVAGEFPEYKKIAVIDMLLYSLSHLNQLRDQIEIHYQNENQRMCSLHYDSIQTANQLSHGEKVLSTIFEMNQNARILYFPVCNCGTDYIDEDSILSSLEEIKTRLTLDHQSIQLVNMSIGSPHPVQRIRLLIEELSHNWPHLIFIAAAGNSGPFSASIQFPSSLESVFSIGTTQFLRQSFKKLPLVIKFNKLFECLASSRGPGDGGIIKPDFIIEGVDSTSIAAASLTGYLSQQSKLQIRSRVEKALLQSSQIHHQLTFCEQGKGILYLAGKIQEEMFEPLIYIFPDNIVLDSEYWMPLYEQITLEDQLYSSINLNLYVLNLHMKQITLHAIDLTKECIVELTPNQISEHNSKGIIQLRLQVKIGVSPLLCQLTLYFQGWQEFTHQLIVPLQSVQIQIQLSSYLQKYTS